MGWQEQNEEQWRKIAFVLQGETSSGVIWVTCDQYQHRVRLLQQFQERFPNYEQTTGKIDQFSGGSLPAYMQEVFKQSGGGSQLDRPQLFHVSGLERYLSYVSGEGKMGFFEALNFERPLFYHALPFVLIFWTDSHTLVQTHRLAADFWEWLTNHFHFEGPADEILPMVQENEFLQERPRAMPSEAEKELLQNRNARLLAQLEESTKLAERISLWMGLADNCFKLRDFSESIRYRQLVLDCLPEGDSALRYLQLHEIVKSRIFNGDRMVAAGQMEDAREQYLLALSSMPQSEFGTARANALLALANLDRRLGNLENARLLYKEAIEFYKAEHWHFGLAIALKGLGDTESGLGEVELARSLYEEAIAYHKKENESFELANALKSLGDLESRLGNVDSARALYEEAIDCCKSEHDNLYLANAKMGIGMLDLRQGEVETAFRVLREVAQIFEREQDSIGIAQSNALLAFMLNGAGRHDIRDQKYKLALAAAVASHIPVLVAYVENVGKEWLN
jgi:tetratricopeptide (TPR) repeat protein